MSTAGRPGATRMRPERTAETAALVVDFLREDDDPAA
jgi:hypothetical protein